MTTQPEPKNQIRASDHERQRIVDALQAAAADGRLTVSEADERIATAYATVYQHELSVLTTDLPARSLRAERAAQWMEQRSSGQTWFGGRVHPAFAVHAMIVLVLSVAIMVRWIVAGTPFFFPIFPIAWFALSLVIHARFRGMWGRPRYAGSRV